MCRQGLDPLNPQQQSWDPAAELGLDIDVDDGCLNFGSPDDVATASRKAKKKTTVFFKIISKNMSRHLLHKDLQIGNSDAIAQVYDVVPDSGDDSTVSISQATGKLAVLSLCLSWCQACCFCLVC